MMIDYEFTNDWFKITAEPLWRQIIPRFSIKRALEIGSFEGQSAVWLLEHCPGVDLTCVDTWEGSLGEHDDIDMAAVERRFDANTAGRATKVKGRSFDMLRAYPAACFDFIYIDGSHRACDVLADGALAWPLLKTGGLMIFDDYFWGPELPASQRPKTAIEAFMNCFEGQFTPLIIGAQVALTKV
jgi:predicted O-methyltransferase YrrM